MTAVGPPGIYCEPCGDNPDVHLDAPSVAVAYLTYPPIPGWPHGRWQAAHVCDLCLRGAVRDAVRDHYPITITPLEPAL